jgi:hypothetical protein
MKLFIQFGQTKNDLCIGGRSTLLFTIINVYNEMSNELQQEISLKNESLISTHYYPI